MRLPPNGGNGENADNRLRLWDARGGAERACLGEDRATVLAFSPDSRVLAAGTADGRVRLWTVEAMLRGATGK